MQDTKKVIRDLYGEERENKIKELILNGTNPNDIIILGNKHRDETVFRWAIGQRSLELIDFIIEHGVNMDYFDEQNRNEGLCPWHPWYDHLTPLGYAMAWLCDSWNESEKAKRLEKVKLLLKRGAGIGKNMIEALAIEKAHTTTIYLKSVKISILLLSSKLCTGPKIKMLPTELIRELMKRFDIWNDNVPELE